MSGHESAPDHKACGKLLPWYVNGTLEPEERDAVDSHLEDCRVCRQDVSSLEELRRYVHAQPEPAHTAATNRGLRQVLNRIDAGAESRLAGVRLRLSPTVRWVFAGQAAAILALVTLLLWPATPDAPFVAAPESFRTLADSPTAEGHGGSRGATLRIVFSDGATEVEALRRLLRSVGAEIVDGPSAVGAYSLRLPGSAGQALERLRADPLVRLVEPVGRR